MTRFLTASIWLVILVTLALLLMTGCAPTDPYQQIDQAKGYLRQTREAAEARDLATAEAEAEDEADRLATAGAAESEIQLVQVAMSGTRAAILAGKDALVLAGDAEQATREAFAYGLSATGTLQAFDATATALPYAATIQAADAWGARERAEASVNFVIVLAALAFGLTIVIVRWAWRVADADIARRRMDTEVIDRQHSAVETRNGTALFKPTVAVVVAEPEQRTYTDLNAIEAMPVRDTSSATAHVRTPDELRAIQLLRDAEAIMGGDSDVIPSWRRMSGWNSDSWQRVVGILKDRGLVRSDQSGTFLERDTLAVIRWELTSGKLPSPIGRDID